MECNLISIHPLLYDNCLLLFKGQSRGGVGANQGGSLEANAQKIKKREFSRKRRRSG